MRSKTRKLSASSNLGKHSLSFNTAAVKPIFGPMQLQIADIVNRFFFYAQDSQDILFDPTAKLKSFMVCDMEDVAVSIRNGIKLPCVLLQVPVYEKEGDVDAAFEHVECSFIVLNKAAIGDYAGRMLAYSACKQIADQFIYRMIQDADEYFDGAMPKTSEGPVGPIGDSIFGWGVNFGFQQAIGTAIDPAKWGAAS